MKRILMVSAMVLITVLFFSCQRTAETAVSQSVEDETVESAEPARTENEGLALRVNASFYTLANDTGSESDRTTWAAAMALGERVSILERRRLTFGGDGAIYDFLRIRRDNGAEGFAFATHIAEAGVLAVLVDERANLFTSPRYIEVTGFTLPRRTVLVLFPETERDGFVEMIGFDTAARVNRRNFIRTSSISRRDSDIQSSILMQTAESLGNEGAARVRKEALMEAALLDYPDSVFHHEILALVNPNIAAVVSTEPLSPHYMYATNSNVNIRDLPDTVAGRVVGSLQYDEEVRVVERTTDEFTIGGQSAHWYRITEPFEGWVFGAFLD